MAVESVARAGITVELDSFRAMKPCSYTTRINVVGRSILGHLGDMQPDLFHRGIHVEVAMEQHRPSTFAILAYLKLVVLDDEILAALVLDVRDP